MTAEPPPGIVVRDVRPEDRAALIALTYELQAYEKRLRPSRALNEAGIRAHVDMVLQRLRRSNGAMHLKVAVKDAEVIGYTSFAFGEDPGEEDPRELEIEAFVVAAAHRHAGAGAALGDCIIATARQHRVYRILGTHLADNKAIAGVYEHFGCVVVTHGRELILEPHPDDGR